MSRIAKALMMTAVTGLAVTSAAGVASASSGAAGKAAGSPGFISGNVGQMPIHIPFNFCGNTGNFIAALNPAFGNLCVNSEGKHGHHKEDRKEER
ncbi:chaplin [Streptomyces sp. YGL11-2]|uniref:chaplin n=1 Tax=Streptomyces sp. YGL11-2 TaxID=3414028 RepID=UPI003CE85375